MTRDKTIMLRLTGDEKKQIVDHATRLHLPIAVATRQILLDVSEVAPRGELIEEGLIDG